MEKKILTILGMILILIVSIFLSGCGGAEPANASSSDDARTASNESSDGEAGDDEGEGADGEEDEDKEEAVPVEVAELARGPIESVLSFSSNLETESQVQVFSPVSYTHLRAHET